MWRIIPSSFNDIDNGTESNADLIFLYAASFTSATSPLIPIIGVGRYERGSILHVLSNTLQDTYVNRHISSRSRRMEVI